VTIYYSLVGALWLTFIVFWIVSAVRAKQNITTRAWWRAAGVRIVIIVIVLFALRTLLPHGLRDARAYIVTTDPVLGIAGVVLCALGVGLAIWARIYLGRNWGLPMSRKEHPELVTSGPYAFVRHPIYAGIILAMLGSAIAETIFWLVPFLIAGAYFVYSARSEEKLMAEEFPDTYPAYRSRTKMLVPFLL
jgi:protein-S-isoprenylcysteine O-methyltransferase Ste14